MLMGQLRGENIDRIVPILELDAFRALTRPPTKTTNFFPRLMTGFNSLESFFSDKFFA
jgi:hypothetical protein